MNLYEYTLNIKTGKLLKGVIEDVTVVNKEKIVRRKDRNYDLSRGLETNINDLNKYVYEVDAKGKKIAVNYVSLNDDVDLEEMKKMAIGIIAGEQLIHYEELKCLLEVQDKIQKLTVD